MKPNKIFGILAIFLILVAIPSASAGELLRDYKVTITAPGSVYENQYFDVTTNVKNMYYPYKNIQSARVHIYLDGQYKGTAYTDYYGRARFRLQAPPLACVALTGYRCTGYVTSKITVEASKDIGSVTHYGRAEKNIRVYFR